MPTKTTVRAISFFVSISLLAAGAGCKKSADTPNNTTNTYQLDSVVSTNAGVTSSLNFIYDGQGRVIEDRYQVGDTLEERYVYEYNGTDSIPFRKKHYRRLDHNPDAISVFQYNSSKQKLYDSTYFPASNDYFLIKIKYYASNRIAVLKDQVFANHTAHNWLADTLYFNTIGKLDSIRVHNGTSQSIFGSWRYWYTQKFTQFDSRQSIFAALSSSQCNIYPMYINNNFGMFTIERFFPVVDYYNQFNCGKISTDILLAAGYGPYSTLDKQFTFNVDNMPISLTQTYTYLYNGNNASTTTQYRFVYQ